MDGSESMHPLNTWYVCMYLDDTTAQRNENADNRANDDCGAAKPKEIIAAFAAFAASRRCGLVSEPGLDFLVGPRALTTRFPLITRLLIPAWRRTPVTDAVAGPMGSGSGQS